MTAHEQVLLPAFMILGVFCKLYLCKCVKSVACDACMDDGVCVFVCVLQRINARLYARPVFFFSVLHQIRVCWTGLMNKSPRCACACPHGPLQTKQQAGDEWEGVGGWRRSKNGGN